MVEHYGITTVQNTVYYCEIVKVSCPFEITNKANPTHFCNLKQCASYKVLKLSISFSKTPST